MPSDDPASSSPQQLQLQLLPALVGSTLPPATTAEAETEEEERVYQVDMEAGALLLKGTCGQGLRWATASQVLPRLRPRTPAASASASSSSAAAVGCVVTTRTDARDRGRGRFTVVGKGKGEEGEVEGEDGGMLVLPPGTLLLEVPAVAAVVAEASLDRACHHCLRPLNATGSKMLECGGCRTTVWCSHACFDAEEGSHPLLCPRLRRVRQRGLLRGLGATAHAVDGDTIRLALQVLATSMAAFERRLARHVERSGGRLEPGQEQLPPGMQAELDEVMALLSHKDEAPAELWEEARAIAEALRAPEAKGGEGGEEEDGMAHVRSDALFKSWPPEALAELLLRVRLNSHPVTLPVAAGAERSPQQQQRVQVLGLFPRLAGAVNHSCRPTAALACRLLVESDGDGGGSSAHWSQRLQAQLRATEPLTPGEEVTYSYLTQVHAPRKDRRQQLLQSFHFHCRCARCQEEKKAGEATEAGDEALACPRCGGRAVRATADAVRCPNAHCGGGDPGAGAVSMPAAAFDRAVTEGQALVARGREAAALTMSKQAAAASTTGAKGGGGTSVGARCAEELLAWLTGAGSGARRLGEGHRLRCEAAMLLLRLAQQQQQPQPQQQQQQVAVAAAAGVMDGFYLAKRLNGHPQRAAVLAARAKALGALASAAEGGGDDDDGDGKGWAAALRAEARAAAREATGVYERALGPGDALTEGARALLGGL